LKKRHQTRAKSFQQRKFCVSRLVGRGTATPRFALLPADSFCSSCGRRSSCE
jgi:hypothetical protein